jgi:hypothetical protein
VAEQIDTGKMSDRRAVKFASPREALADADVIAAAEWAGKLRRTGNWTTGQTFGHLAAWIDYSFDGYPLIAPPEMAAKARAALRTRVLDGRMMPGFHIPGVEGGTAGIEEFTLDEGLTRLRRAWRRIEGACPTKEHAFFGPMTHEEWIKLQLRHSELHHSFLHPTAPGATD